MATPLRVLCVTPYGIDGRGGIDRLYFYLRQFHDPQALAGIELRYFAARGNAPGALWTVAFPWRVLLFVAQALLWRPNVVHLNFATGGSVVRKYALLRIAKLFGAATVIHFHGQFSAADLAAWSPWRRLFIRLCRQADRIVVLGTCYRHAFIGLLGVPAHKLVIVPNGIPDFAADVSLPKPRRAVMELAFLGEVGIRKGTDILLEALVLLRQRTVAWSCVVAGNGDVAHFRSMAGALGLGDQVRFTGWVDAETVHRLARDCDVVVLPSRSDALPLTLLEGACAGAALVATPVGEIPDIVQDGVNGLIIEAAPAALAAALQRLIERPDELGRMQAASRRVYVERFRMAAFAAALRALYLDTAACRAGRPARGYSIRSTS